MAQDYNRSWLRLAQSLTVAGALDEPPGWFQKFRQLSSLAERSGAPQPMCRSLQVQECVSDERFALSRMTGRARELPGLPCNAHRLR
jgi:hypothetical protein